MYKVEFSNYLLYKETFLGKDQGFKSMSMDQNDYNKMRLFNVKRGHFLDHRLVQNSQN